MVGLFYDLLGIIILNEILASSAKWKSVSAELIAPMVLGAHTVIPLSTAFGAAIGYFTHYPSASTVFTFAFGFFGYSLIPLTFLEVTVVNPQFPIFRTTESRWRYLGLWLLLSGVSLQLIATIIAFKAA